VRVIYTGGGMSKLLTVTESVMVEKYGVEANQYAGFAALRGDPSDGLPGVAGIGEKTASGLMREFGDLDGVIAAASDENSGMSSSVRAKITAAADYLAVAPTVVAVVRDLKLAKFEPDISDPAGNEATLDELAERFGLGGSMDRARTALATASGRRDP
jgi:5'-3' exonuclease